MRIEPERNSGAARRWVQSVRGLEPPDEAAEEELFRASPRPTRGCGLGGRWIGVGAVPTRCIRGTASLAMPVSRGVDFLPLAGREPSDWRSRWTRLEAAVDNEVVLPPVELIRARGEYWVIDGHNRVALAKQHGQLWIDADITELDILEPDTAEPDRARTSSPPRRRRRTAMQYTQLGERGPRVSRIAFGNWSAGGDWGKVDRDAAIAATREALALGINLFDTARAYGFGAAEQLLGEALNPRSSRLASRSSSPPRAACVRKAATLSGTAARPHCAGTSRRA